MASFMERVKQNKFYYIAAGVVILAGLVVAFSGQLGGLFRGYLRTETHFSLERGDFSGCTARQECYLNIFIKTTGGAITINNVASILANSTVKLKIVDGSGNGILDERYTFKDYFEEVTVDGTGTVNRFRFTRPVTFSSTTYSMEIAFENLSEEMNLIYDDMSYEGTGEVNPMEVVEETENPSFKLELTDLKLWGDEDDRSSECKAGDIDGCTFGFALKATDIDGTYPLAIDVLTALVAASDSIDTHLEISPMNGISIDNIPFNQTDFDIEHYGNQIGALYEDGYKIWISLKKKIKFQNGGDYEISFWLNSVENNEYLKRDGYEFEGANDVGHAVKTLTQTVGDNRYVINSVTPAACTDEGCNIKVDFTRNTGCSPSPNIIFHLKKAGDRTPTFLESNEMQMNCSSGVETTSALTQNKHQISEGDEITVRIRYETPDTVISYDTYNLMVTEDMLPAAESAPADVANPSTGITDLTTQIALNFNYTPEFTIKFKTNAQTLVDVSIYDSTNRKIRTLKDWSNDPVPANTVQEVKWDGRNDAGNLVSPGDYKYKLLVVDVINGLISYRAESTAVIGNINVSNATAELPGPGNVGVEKPGDEKDDIATAGDELKERINEEDITSTQEEAAQIELNPDKIPPIDLIVDNLKFTNSAGKTVTTLEAGSKYSLTANIKNVGTGALTSAQNSLVKFKLTVNNSEIKNLKTTTMNTGTGNYLILDKVEINTPTYKKGTNSVVFTVDANDAISESSEGNNTKVLNVTMNVSEPAEEPEDGPPSLTLPTFTPPTDLGTPPEDDTVTPPSLTPPASTDLKITASKVFPVSFNPQIKETKVTYIISENAIVEVKIQDKSGNRVVTLTNDSQLSAGEHSVWWNGTDTTDDSGTIVDPGTYEYVIKAKDPATSSVKDTAMGEIEVVYAVDDFEDIITPAPVPTPTPVPVPTPTPSDNGSGTVIMSGQATGRTSETGPEIMIYALFPLAGYFFRRKKT